MGGDYVIAIIGLGETKLVGHIAGIRYICGLENRAEEVENSIGVTNFIQPYLHQFFIDSHGLNGYGKPLKRPFDRY